MNINQIEVKGITYQVEDAEARSGLAQAVVDIDTIKKELSKKAVFNDIPQSPLENYFNFEANINHGVCTCMKRSGIVFLFLNISFSSPATISWTDILSWKNDTMKIDSSMINTQLSPISVRSDNRLLGNLELGCNENNTKIRAVIPPNVSEYLYAYGMICYPALKP